MTVWQKTRSIRQPLGSLGEICQRLLIFDCPRRECAAKWNPQISSCSVGTIVGLESHFQYCLFTGDPRFTRFQFTRIHTTRFFQGLRGRGLMGSTEPLILKICSKTCQYCKIQEKFVTFALNQCFSNS